MEKDKKLNEINNMMTSSLFSFVKKHSDIVETIEEFSSINKEGGKYFEADCPLCDKTNTLRINLEKSVFYCFGCHEGGDVIAFIEKIKGISAMEACEYLADRYNFNLDDAPFFGQ